jgi:hypothetical protein
VSIVYQSSGASTENTMPTPIPPRRQRIHAVCYSYLTRRMHVVSSASIDSGGIEWRIAHGFSLRNITNTI